jgi:CheY-like chemotaxis protein
LIDVGTVIREACTFAMSGSRTLCSVEIAQDLWGIEADPGQIGQVLQNLLLNADQAMPEGGQVTVRAQNARVAPGALPLLGTGEFVRISVQDQGIGIAPQHQDRIFDPYFTTKQRGSGLGLSVCHSIVNNHEGSIQVQSELGHGTTFHVYLPAVESTVGAGVAVDVQVRTGRGRLLIMDDDAVIRNVAEAMITHLGYELTMARDGGEAIELFSSAISEGRPYDAVILDLTVPGGMGGKATMERLRALDSGVRAIVSSGYSNDPILAEHRRWGFSGFLCKPYQLDELSRVLAEVLAA